MTWGAIGWLNDIRRWTAIVAEFLAPGGFLYLAEHHPFPMLLRPDGERLYCHYPWRSAPDDPIVEDDPTTYTGDATTFTHTRAYFWNHTLSDIIGGLIDNGLRLDFLHEHETVPWQMFPMRDRDRRRHVRAAGRLSAHPPLLLAQSIEAGGVIHG